MGLSSIWEGANRTSKWCISSTIRKESRCLGHNNKTTHGGWYLLSGLNGRRRRHYHQYTICEDGGNDEQRKQRMHQNINRYTADRIEGVQQVAGLVRRKAENILTPTNHNERLQLGDRPEQCC